MKHIWLFLLLLAACRSKPTTYISKPVIFQSGLLSTDLYEFGGTFSPDGKVFLFTLSSPNYYIKEYTILFSVFDGMSWSTPEVVPFSGLFSDRDPRFSIDGKDIFFSSKRPLSNNDKQDFDIWRVSFDIGNIAFGDPEHLNINSPRPELTPFVDGQGNLYFSSVVPGDSFGSLDLYKSDYLHSGIYGAPVNLGGLVNTPAPEAYPFISLDGKQLFFASRRAEGTGDYDIYRSDLVNSSWTEAIELDSTINSLATDVSPHLYDGNIYFSSTRQDAEKEITSTQIWVQVQQSILNGQSNLYFTPQKVQ